MSASVSSETMNFVTELFNFESVIAVVIALALAHRLQRSRRKDTASLPTPQKRAACHGARKKHAAKLNDSEKSTDISGSDPIIGGSSTDGSGSDSPTKDANKTFVAVRPAPGLGICPPPGLEAPPGLQGVKSNRMDRGQGARLNSHAKVFIPSAGAYPKVDDNQNRSQRLRESIHLLKDSIEEWEAEHPGAQFQQRKPAESVDNNTLSALSQAISKLSPQDAAVVRSFLHAKESGMEMNLDVTNKRVLCGDQFQRPLNGSQSTGGNLPWRNHPVGAQPAQRPFVPFQSTKKPPRQQPPMDDDADTLRTNLKDLSQLDSNRVILVRRINRLGLDSAAALEGYFSKFGAIDRLMVSHSRSKSTNGSTRMRPATVGFVVMKEAADAMAILAHGEGHDVLGVSVVVSTFQSHTIDA